MEKLRSSAFRILRKVFQQILDGMSTEAGHFNYEQGYRGLLSSLLQSSLELDQIMNSGQLSAGRVSACKVLESAIRRCLKKSRTLRCVSVWITYCSPFQCKDLH